jgi:hypothetical protein
MDWFFSDQNHFLEQEEKVPDRTNFSTLKGSENGTQIYNPKRFSMTPFSFTEYAPSQLFFL